MSVRLDRNSSAQTRCPARCRICFSFPFVFALERKGAHGDNLWRTLPTPLEFQAQDFDHRTVFLIHLLEMFKKVTLMTSQASSFPLSARLGLWISTTTIRQLLSHSLAIVAISAYTCFPSHMGNRPFRGFRFKVASALGTVCVA
jgi:hypothetical protein